MSMDTLSNALSAIKNAAMVDKKSIELPYSKKVESVTKVIEKAGYLSEVKAFKEKGVSHKSLRIDLAFGDEGSKITDVKIVSKPGRRIYSTNTHVKRIDPEFGLVVVSTSKGLMSGEDARKKKLGGEVICEVR